MPLSTPIAFCIFNRPELTARTFERIAAARPERLLIIADGPRPHVPKDLELVQATRRIVQRIDWPCQVQRAFSTINLGCGKRMASGLDWAFAQSDRLIVLEDDCLPDPSFFSYCDALLERFAENRRVMMISGNNFQPNDVCPGASYYFSKWPHIWGWASWRRAWTDFRHAPTWWNQPDRIEHLQSIFPQADEFAYWNHVLTRFFDGHIDTWDFQWCYAIWRRNGLTVLPARNLVSNLGFGPNATHTIDADSAWAQLPANALGVLRHPANIAAHTAADRWTFENVFAGDPPATGERQPASARSAWRRWWSRQWKSAQKRWNRKRAG